MNIEITIVSPTRAVAQAEAAALARFRVEEHQRGLHPVGSMRRDCPLCTGGGR